MHEGIMLCPNMTYPMFDSFILKFWQLQKYFYHLISITKLP
jgi:hypothetical protein